MNCPAERNCMRSHAELSLIFGKQSGFTCCNQVVRHLDEHFSCPAHGTHCSGGHTLHVVIEAHDLPHIADRKVLRRGSFATTSGGAVAVGGKACLFLRSAQGSVTAGCAAVLVPAFAACACDRRVRLRSMLVVAFLGSGGDLPLRRQGLCLLLCEVLVPAIPSCRVSSRSTLMHFRVQLDVDLISATNTVSRAAATQQCCWHAYDG